MDFTDAIDNLVRAVSACISFRDWQAVLLDLELREMPDGFDSDYVAIVLIAAADGQLTQDQIVLDAAARQAAMALHIQRKDAAEEHNAGLVLELDRSGAFHITFKEKVKRLAGVWDEAEESFIDNYLQHYRQNNGTPSQS